MLPMCHMCVHFSGWYVTNACVCVAKSDLCEWPAAGCDAYLVLMCPLTKLLRQSIISL